MLFRSVEPVYNDNTQTLKAASIPFGEWYDVLEIGTTQHSKGGTQLFARIQVHEGKESKKYFLPRIIKELLIDHTKKKNVVLKDLKGWRLRRAADGLVKTIPKSKHNEPPVTLIDSNGFEISNHASSSPRNLSCASVPNVASSADVGCPLGSKRRVDPSAVPDVDYVKRAKYTV